MAPINTSAATAPVIKAGVRSGNTNDQNARTVENGHQRHCTRPIMYFFGTNPQWRLSELFVPVIAHYEVVPLRNNLRPPILVAAILGDHERIADRDVIDVNAAVDDANLIALL